MFFFDSSESAMCAVKPLWFCWSPEASQGDAENLSWTRLGTLCGGCSNGFPLTNKQIAIEKDSPMILSDGNICAQRKYCSGKLIELYPLWINIQVDLSPQWISLKQTISSIPYSYVNYPWDCRFRISKNWYSNDRPFLSPIVSLETESNMCRFKYHFCGLNIHLYKSSTKCCG